MSPPHQIIGTMANVAIKAGRNCVCLYENAEVLAEIKADNLCSQISA
jgi:hypothetical protein